MGLKSMKIVTPTQMSLIDQKTIEKAGIPSLILMENGAHSTVDLIIQNYGNVNGLTITVIAGRGNNGGDAFAVARHLYNKGAKVRVFMAGRAEKLKDGTWINYNVLENIGIAVNEIIFTTGMEYFTKSIKESKLIIDGLFGTGLNREVQGIDKKIIDIINSHTQKTHKNFETHVVSIDIPSGIHGESGKVMGSAIKASITVAFGLIKQGIVLHPGVCYAGKVELVDISIPANIVNESGINTFYTRREDVSSFIPERRQNSHKGSYGKVLIITGSVGMTGAGSLSGMSALRSGAGMCYLAVPESLAHIYSISAPECVLIPLQDNGGVFTRDCMVGLINIIQSVDSVVIGPGISINEHLIRLLEWVIENSAVPIIIDADAITLLSYNLEIIKKKRAPIIITPHTAEMGKVIGQLSEFIDEDRVNVARSFAVQNGIIVLLKGNRTVIANINGDVWINSTGNSGMSTAGSGDVLAGMIAGICAQSLKVEFKDNGLVYDKHNKLESIYKSTIAAAFVHGLSGEIASKTKGEYGIVARDILENIPQAILHTKQN
jgi:NAD(P)H-hydrate epimerase